MAAKTGEKYSKCERTTQEQLQHYIQFCNEHPELQAGKNSPRAPRSLEKLWEQLAGHLNAMRGPTRTPDKWKECLTHWKHQLRCRVRKAKAHAQATGGGPPTASLTEFDQQAFQTFGAAAVNGISDVGALGIEDLPQLPSDSETSISSVPSSSAALTPNIASPAESSSSPTPTSSQNRRGITLDTVFKATMESIKAREQREERALAQQIQLTQALNNMAQGLINMSETLQVLAENLKK